LKISRIFYGYWILLACFLLTLIASGCGPISFSFFVTSLEKALGWSRTEIMAAFIGLLAGVLPARHAANLDPIEALRAE